MNSKRKKILYVMHVPWGWIKQRPHFFAEKLSQDYQVKILYKRPFKKNIAYNKNNNNLDINGFWRIPFNRIPALRSIQPLRLFNSLLLRFSAKNSIEKYDYIWITSLSLYPSIKPFIGKKTSLIWDCMDDELEFGPVKNNPFLSKELLRIEKELINRTDILFCSSLYLSQKIQKRTGINRVIYVVNNAIELPDPNVNTLFSETIESKIKSIEGVENIFMYIGAISEWFDFGLIMKMLDANPKSHLVLLGPADVPIPTHPRIIYLGPIERKWIFRFMDKAKVLIMPFKITELIRSVNPVKLYEYIHAERIVLVPYYEEIEKFSDYVYMYNTTDEFLSISRNIIDGGIINKDHKKSTDYIKKNQWINRYHQILDILRM